MVHLPRAWLKFQAGDPNARHMCTGLRSRWVVCVRRAFVVLSHVEVSWTTMQFTAQFHSVSSPRRCKCLLCLCTKAPPTKRADEALADATWMNLPKRIPIHRIHMTSEKDSGTHLPLEPLQKAWSYRIQKKDPCCCVQCACCIFFELTTTVTTVSIFCLLPGIIHGPGCRWHSLVCLHVVRFVLEIF